MSKSAKDSADDPSLRAARYRLAQQDSQPVPVDEYAQRTGRRPVPQEPRTPLQFHAQDEAWEVANTVLDQAFARGDFDHLALSGKKIDHLTSNDDPDWWLKSMMRREQISGLGPPALTLRVEDEQLPAHLDTLPTASAVRAHLTDFNQRVIEARRQLLGGPPVITKLRDIDAELAAWATRRSTPETPSLPLPVASRRRWWSWRK